MIVKYVQVLLYSMFSLKSQLFYQGRFFKISLLSSATPVILSISFLTQINSQDILVGQCHKILSSLLKIHSYCRFEKAKAKVSQLGIERVANSLERSFNDTVSVLNEIFLKIKDFQQVHAHLFIALYEKKHAIEGNILQIASQYYQAQIELEKAIKKAKEKIDAALNS